MSSHITRSSRGESHLQKLARLEGLQMSSRSGNSNNSTELESDIQADCEDFEDNANYSNSNDSKLMEVCWQRAEDLVSKFLSSRNEDEEISESSKSKSGARVSSGSSKNSQSTDASKTYSEIYSAIYEESKARQQKADDVCKFYNLNKLSGSMQDRTERWVKQMGQPDRNDDELETESSARTTCSSSIATDNRTESDIEQIDQKETEASNSQLDIEEEEEIEHEHVSSNSELYVEEEEEEGAEEEIDQEDAASYSELEEIVEEEIVPTSPNTELNSVGEVEEAEFISNSQEAVANAESDIVEEIDENALTQDELDIIWQHEETYNFDSDFEKELVKGPLFDEEVEIISQYKRTQRNTERNKATISETDRSLEEELDKEAVIQEELEIMSNYKLNPISSRISQRQDIDQSTASSNLSSLQSSIVRSNYSKSGSNSNIKSIKKYQDRANSPIDFHRLTPTDQTNSFGKSTESVGIQYPSDTEICNELKIPLGLRIHNADEALMGVKPENFNDSMIILDDDSDFLNLSLSDNEEQIHSKLMAAALGSKRSSPSLTGNLTESSESSFSADIDLIGNYTPSVYFYRRSDSDVAEEQQRNNNGELTPEKDYVAYLAERSLRACTESQRAQEVVIKPRLKREASRKAEELYASEMQFPADRQSLVNEFNKKLKRQLKILTESFQ